MQCDSPDLFAAARQARDALPQYGHLIGKRSVHGRQKAPMARAEVSTTKTAVNRYG